MVNMDYIPEGFTLDEMLAAFSEEAEVEYENARIDQLPQTQIASLRIRAEATKARQALAQLLLQDIQVEAGKGEAAAFTISADSSSKPRYTLESVSEWAAFKYGIGIPEWSHNSVSSAPSRNVPVDARWEDIEIRIRINNKIAYSHKEGKWEEKVFGEIGLLDKRTQSPNHHACILIGMSNGKKFPTSSTIEDKDKTAISKLRTSLKSLTGIADDPFTVFNKANGWKPRFKLTYDTRNADRRAEKAAIHEQYNDEKNYDDENDDAGKFLNSHE